MASKTLTLGIGGDRTRLGEDQAAVIGARIEDLSIEGAILKDRISARISARNEAWLSVLNGSVDSSQDPIFIRYFERGAPDGPPKKRKKRESGGNTILVLFGCSAAS
jgi:hypothetical protein